MNINSYKTSNYKGNRLAGQQKNEPKQTQFLPAGLSVIALAKMEALAKEGQTHRAGLTSAESAHSASHLGYKFRAGSLAGSVGLTNIGLCVLN